MNTAQRARLMRLRFLMEQKALLPEYQDKSVSGSPAMLMAFNLATLAETVVNWTGEACPTAGCAIGTAMFDRRFNEDGLTAEKPNPDVISSLNKFDILPYHPYPQIDGRRVGFDSYEMAEYFGITRHELREIVEPDCYEDVWRYDDITPEMVIEKIDAVLENYREEVL